MIRDSSTIASGKWLPVLAPMLLLLMATGGCDCATGADQARLEGDGAKWVGGGPFSACGAAWLWFEPKKHQISDQEFAAFCPAIRRLHPQALQLYEQRLITDRSIDSINLIPSLTTVLIDGTAITASGRKRLRPGIEVLSGAGYR